MVDVARVSEAMQDIDAINRVSDALAPDPGPARVMAVKTKLIGVVSNRLREGHPVTTSHVIEADYPETEVLQLRAKLTQDNGLRPEAS